MTTPTTYTLKLDMPPLQLLGNARGHTKWLASHAAKAKKDAEAVTRAACNDQPRWEKANISYVFVFKTNRLRDDDNYIYGMKHARDGIAAAGLVINDRVFVTQPVEMRVDKTATEPHVLVTITKI